MVTTFNFVDGDDKNVINVSATIKDAALKLEKAEAKIVFVVDDHRRLIGSITDGDFRRGMLRSLPLSVSVEKIMNKNPISLKEGASKGQVLRALGSHRICHIGVTDINRRLVGFKSSQSFSDLGSLQNAVLVMAGGEGQRLRPLTETCPKPMLKVGGRPLLETTLLNCVKQGLTRFYFSVNYRGKQIRDYFGDGSHWGVSIAYVEEEKKLGTAGVLSRLSLPNALPLLVINGDILTNADFPSILRFHGENDSKATMAVREYEMQVPYGVVETDTLNITDLREKPVQRFFVNAGIYVLDADVINMVPGDRFYDMPNLFEAVRDQELATLAYPLHEYWRDIGHLDDFNRANYEYEKYFG